ncbi:hypothetical protein P9B03_08515 [Metasolibacillus meyeri]|uniref:Uncharacterized protein n=1 Tax=Metasolibacillus meyeri TaxID=1071052 RepID=A0AAW9NPV6_9BACL|nr:hypothetical protein [Metasolibacillus meyeri]MEC1178521.1 hypothetical protein [Metasolibacillus meyeri]
MNNIVNIPSAEVDHQKNVCAICKKQPVVRWCDYIIRYDHAHIFLRNPQASKEPNRRGAQYKTCDLPMCENCVHEASLDHDLCPHHSQLLRQAMLPTDYQRERQQLEKVKIARIEMGLETDLGDINEQMQLFDE